MQLFDYYVDSEKSPVFDDRSYQMLLQKYGTDSKILFITADIRGIVFLESALSLSSSLQKRSFAKSLFCEEQKPLYHFLSVKVSQS